MGGGDEDLTDDFGGGWDNRVTLVAGWVERTPRRPDRAAALRRETALLPWLAPRLPLPVPEPEIVSEDPLTVRYRYLPGRPCPGTSPVHGTSVGGFLVALHGLDPDEAVRHGARTAAETHAEVLESVTEMERAVLPRLPARLLGPARALLDRMSRPATRATVAHRDLGPEHIRVVGDLVGGVIDWGDSGVGDPALDLAWTAVGATAPFTRAVVAAYRPDEETWRRAHDWHQLGPWHEVLYGLGDGGPGFVESGLAGVVARLERYGTPDRG